MNSVIIRITQEDWNLWPWNYVDEAKKIFILWNVMKLFDMFSDQLYTR